jgi:hypothetical protein
LFWSKIEPAKVEVPNPVTAKVVVVALVNSAVGNVLTAVVLVPIN